ncbi:54S ribosomal protein L9, mitochondrial [Schizosaccharomyces pombe]|uniref:Large ribosomal subunit protein uL3m n=1 Tax=Schizosaccharomyces pombe (strain 972 / ATCC 24843) TaxID=284812 RepID=RM09_SCHPO|nr:putative mitochondrial ribosomal protein subunit L9 [Schizosaccharomyces pombe]Q9P6P6.1 RecName: Full=Large ribosomal subunit protein uL3m; AltName: Full=54S ribosomal protein L9, mitochondrial; Flags: Precursor [Schizosaccharomyces pombe 972h-]CAB90144.1 mitochondrial ribosomal protein subunit L9 (predicted) [Schizosaccharomyces pombe]|eukprot:NP_593885.1 putative mitochondrial ribosomal protein subunit L9 [Schizosaccharomyces pombe]
MQSRFLISPTLIRTFAHHANLTPRKILHDLPEAAHARKQIPLRPGVILVKKGMTNAWDEKTGMQVPLTILQFDRVQAIDVRTKEKHGYYAVQVGSGIRKPKSITKAEQGNFFSHNIYPKMHVREFRVRDASGLVSPGTIFTTDYFKPKQYVDVKGITKGKGFAGVMKRWGFSGGNASHGASLSHRTPGSTGQNTTPSRVLPGRKMAGHMGHRSRTVKNLLVWAVDADLECILVKGSIPGPNKSAVYVTDTINRSTSATN